jgi:hypothetical protein
VTVFVTEREVVVVVIVVAVAVVMEGSWRLWEMLSW